jgi:ribonuclease D
MPETVSAPFEYIDQPEAFAAVLDHLSRAQVYAVDTEFHRERTYYPRVALVQIKWGDRLVLVDPLAVDLEPLGEVLDGPGLVVMHAAGQDLEVMLRECGTVPRRMFDTQIAAGFLGMRSPSLAALHERILGMRLGKGDRLTDWLRRPLEPNQLAYAASDVEHLLEIYDALVADLEARSRTEWAEAETEKLRRKMVVARDPDDAWLRIKETRHLKGPARGVARAVGAWRETVASERDLPPRFILSDLAVVSVAQKAPASIEALAKLRGVEERQARGPQGEEILAAVVRGLAEGPPKRERAMSRGDQVSLRPAASLLSAWIAQYANELELDPALLGTRSDVEALLRGEPSRLSEGWRNDLAGEPIRRLVAGDASLAFAGGGKLLLESRSGEPIVTVGRPGDAAG